MGNVHNKARWSALARVFRASGTMHSVSIETLSERLLVGMEDHMSLFAWHKGDGRICAAVYHWPHEMAMMVLGDEADLDAELNSLGCTEAQPAQ